MASRQVSCHRRGALVIAAARAPAPEFGATDRSELSRAYRDRRAPPRRPGRARRRLTTFDPDRKAARARRRPGGRLFAMAAATMLPAIGGRALLDDPAALKSRLGAALSAMQKYSPANSGALLQARRASRGARARL